MGKPTKQGRHGVQIGHLPQPAKASPPAPAQITAADVWEFRNSEDAQASNRLVADTIADTMENCACVLAFLSDFHARKTGSQMNGKAQAGLCSVVEWVGDAIEKQARELEVHNG